MRDAKYNGEISSLLLAGLYFSESSLQDFVVKAYPLPPMTATIPSTPFLPPFAPISNYWPPLPSFGHPTSVCYFPFFQNMMISGCKSLDSLVAELEKAADILFPTAGLKPHLNSLTSELARDLSEN